MGGRTGIDIKKCNWAYYACIYYILQGGPSGRGKPPVDLDLGCSTILPGQKIATVTAHHLAELSELGQWEVSSDPNRELIRETLALQVIMPSSLASAASSPSSFPASYSSARAAI